MGLSAQEEDAFVPGPIRGGALPPGRRRPYQPVEGEQPYRPPEQGATPSGAELQDAPRWVLAMAILSGGGLVLGLLMVMVASLENEADEARLQFPDVAGIA